MSDFVIDEFYKEMEGVKFETYGIIDSQNKIHTLGTDSKIIGRVFEMFTQPVLEKIANQHKMMLKTPESQTAYPDFIMMSNTDSKEKIAIDVKTTYIESDQSAIKFTLGSYGSYMRNNTKNIEFAYTDYSKHYVVGFVYKRNGQAQESRIFDYSDKDKIVFPFCDVKYFIQEKYKIAGDKPGSGNTENIGSFVTNDFRKLKEGGGPFAELGENVYDIYWKYFPRFKSEEKSYLSLEQFADWFSKQSKSEIVLLHEFDYEETRKRILEYAQRISKKK